MTRPACSIVIPSHNRVASLENLLEALSRQTVPADRFEVLPVLDGSTDGSAAMLARWHASGRLPHLRWLEQPQSGQAAARTAGTARATAPVVIFLDDDIIPAPGLVAAHLNRHERDEPIAVLGPAPLTRRPNDTWYRRLLWVWWEDVYAHRNRPDHLPSYRDFCAGNASVRCEDFLAVGGFDPAFAGYGGEDYDLGYRLMEHGVRLVAEPSAVAEHRNDSTVDTMLRNARQEGRHDVLLGRKHPALRPGLRLMLNTQGARAVFTAPRLWDGAAAALRAWLAVLERCRLRGSWRRLFGRLRHLAYWRGVVDALGDWPAYAAYCASAPLIPACALDLTDGVPEPLPSLWTHGPCTLTVTAHGQRIGRLRLTPPPLGLTRREVADQILLRFQAQLDQVFAAAGRNGAAGAHALPPVSVIIPTRNAEATLAEALESLLAQSQSAWEACVVDDGSTDGTAAIAQDYAARDHRISLLRQPHAGVSQARNRGLAQARHEWTLFLDADDRLAPDHLARMGQVLSDHPQADAAYCGWVRVGPQGPGIPHRPAGAHDLFPVLARTCAFAMHGCLVRTALARTAGGFDETLRICEDWDLWQRIARTGAMFVPVPGLTAVYRMRPHSGSIDGARMLQHGLRVLERGHGPDPRVKAPHPSHAGGRPAAELPELRYNFLAWTAGLLIGQGQDPLPLLDLLPDAPEPGLSGLTIAQQLFEAVLVPSCRVPAEWRALWGRTEPLLSRFLDALERRSTARGLAADVRRHLERLVLESALLAEPAMLGHWRAERLEITQPIPSLSCPPPIERVLVLVEMNGERLSQLALPVRDGRVQSGALADAIAAKCSWIILNRWFEWTLGAEIGAAVDGDEVLLRRGDLVLDRVPGGRLPGWDVVHDRVGWALLLQELFGERAWTGEAFFEAKDPTAPGPARKTEGTCTVELSEPIPALSTPEELVRVRLTVGGVALGAVAVQASGAGVAPGALRAALLAAVGYDLCRAVVRGAVVGRPFPDAAGSLRERLSAQARAIGDAPRQVLPPALAPLSNGRRLSDSARPLDRDLGYDREHFEQLFAAREDPWEYTTGYEQVKYEQTLSLLPDRPIARALELACAEGHFTRQLAPRAQELIAADISDIALSRAAARCRAFPHVTFRRLDLGHDPLPGAFDLIVCSEVLYYQGTRERLRAAAARFADHLNPGGYLLTAHANVLADAPDEPGFDWPLPFGAKTITDTFADEPRLRVVKELRTPLYRIQLLQRAAGGDAPPELITTSAMGEQRPESARHVRWQGGAPAPAPAASRVTTHLPILMYHRIVADGPPSTARYRVSPAQLETQLRYLRDAGYHSVTLDAWQDAARRRQPLPGKAVALTFDDGYRDFLTQAWPLLKRYGFGATLFLVAGAIGTTNAWDTAHGEAVPLLGWDELRRLQEDGMTFGSHALTHQPLTALPIDDAARELLRSRCELEEALRRPVRWLSYPYGAAEEALAHLAGACGYTAAVTCEARRAALRDDPLLLPRIEVSGTDSFAQFVQRMAWA